MDTFVSLGFAVNVKCREIYSQMYTLHNGLNNNVMELFSSRKAKIIEIDFAASGVTLHIY